MDASSYDKTNESAYKYMKNVAKDLATLSAPLSEYLGIKMFGYARVFSDDRYIVVNNRLDFSKYFLQFILEEDSSHLRAEDFTPLQLSLAPGEMIPWICSETPKSKMAQFKQHHGLGLEFLFTRKLPDSMEYWIFSGDKESSNIRDFFIRNKDTLLKFVRFFNASNADIIKYGGEDEERIGFYKGGHNFVKELQQRTSAHERLAINAFLEELNKKSKYLHKVKPEFTYLTSRERECLSYLAKGDTAKEVARNLELSPHTVEVHLKTIKHKTGLHSRSQLVKFFLTHFS